MVSSTGNAFSSHLVHKNQDMLNPVDFFKINRSELMNKSYIEKINSYTKNTVAFHIKTHVLKTSQNNTASFNSWMELLEYSLIDLLYIKNGKEFD